jgi:uncharacterized protein (TIGR02996 family)
VSDFAALLAAVIAAPDEDDPRLVMADWYDENGDHARAEFIRVQCRIADLQRDCRCGSCVRIRGGGQHHNGPCAVDKERDELPDGTSRQAFLRRRERELWCRRSGWHKSWFQPLPVTSYFTLGEVECESDLQPRFLMRRGFPGAVRLSAADWRAHGDAIRAAHPVTRVTLTTWEGNWWGQTFMTDGRYDRFTCDRWPGVEFVLPPTPVPL